MAHIINKATGKKVAEILTNHSMTLDEAISLVGTIDFTATEEDVQIGDSHYFYDDLELVYGEEPDPEIEDYDTSACSLYDGGWRSSDRAELIEEYRLTEDEAARLCEKLEELEKDKNKEKDQ